MPRRSIVASGLLSLTACVANPDNLGAPVGPDGAMVTPLPSAAGATPLPNPIHRTWGEEEDGRGTIVTTMALGEEDGSGPLVTTLALGEEEDGGGTMIEDRPMVLSAPQSFLTDSAASAHQIASVADIMARLHLSEG